MKAESSELYYLKKYLNYTYAVLLSIRMPISQQWFKNTDLFKIKCLEAAAEITLRHREELLCLELYFYSAYKDLLEQKISFSEWNSYFNVLENAIKANIEFLDYMKLANYLVEALVITINPEEAEAYETKKQLLTRLIEILSNREEHQKRYASVSQIYQEMITEINNNYLSPKNR